MGFLKLFTCFDTYIKMFNEYNYMGLIKIH